MKLTERINAMAELGQYLNKEDEFLDALMHRSYYNNRWFTIENQKQSLEAIRDFFLSKEKLETWTSKYKLADDKAMKKVGIVMAGNIPLVGFHDLLSVFIAGHHAMIKLSEKDHFVLPYLLKKLKEIDAQTEPYFSIVSVVKEADAVIATGSNNSSRYFEYYFSKMPSIIRKNRNAIAVLTGKETREELHELGRDIFQYFGLGCRNVSKLYVPADYNFKPLMEVLHEFRTIIQHSKYKNNFDYNFAIQVLNKNKYKANGCIIVSENESFQSRVGELYYEHYENLEKVEKILQERSEEIQCVVAQSEVLTLPTIRFGLAQQPQLWDYADGVDTMAFLEGL